MMGEKRGGCAVDALLNIYHPELPAFLAPFLALPELERLRRVGMNCGCEYTSFPRFVGLPESSRYHHSLGAALITWHFTGETAPTLAALFHDIATPVFAHTVDFLRGDYLAQEATEDGTGEMLRRSGALSKLLAPLGLTVEDVEDYHQYPVADNDSPRLSADRLEYTLRNILHYRFGTPDDLRRFYDDLRVTAESGVPELAFEKFDTARDFAFAALRCSEIYVSPEDRYAMQRLSELLKQAIARGVLKPEDLYGVEPDVIARLNSDPETNRAWSKYCALHEMVTDASAPEADRRVIRAKKRCIDPWVTGQGRLSGIDPAFAAALTAFREESQEDWLCAR